MRLGPSETASRCPRWSSTPRRWTWSKPELALADERTDDARTLLVDLVNRRLADLAITDPHAISYLELDIDRTIMRSAALLVDDAESYDLELARRSLPQVLGARARPTAPPARLVGSRVAGSNGGLPRARMDGRNKRRARDVSSRRRHRHPVGRRERDRDRGRAPARAADPSRADRRCSGPSSIPRDDAPLSSVGVRRLHDLGTDLLPPSAWSAPTVLVTSDGVLDLVPFRRALGPGRVLHATRCDHRRRSPPRLPPTLPEGRARRPDVARDRRSGPSRSSSPTIPPASSVRGQPSRSRSGALDAEKRVATVRISRHALLRRPELGRPLPAVRGRARPPPRGSPVRDVHPSRRRGRRIGQDFRARHPPHLVHRTPRGGARRMRKRRAPTSKRMARRRAWPTRSSTLAPHRWSRRCGGSPTRQRPR